MVTRPTGKCHKKERNFMNGLLKTPQNDTEFDLF
jgi:hypothetical protein